MKIKIKKKSKTSYYPRKLKLFEGDIKKDIENNERSYCKKREVHVIPFPKN